MKLSRSLWTAGLLLLGLAVPAVPLPEEGERTLDVIVLSRDAASARAFATRDARALGAQVVTRLKRVPVSVVRIPASQLAALRSLPDVRAVEKDFAFSIDDLQPADPKLKRSHATTPRLSAAGSRPSIWRFTPSSPPATPTTSSPAPQTFGRRRATVRARSWP